MFPEIMRCVIYKNHFTCNLCVVHMFSMLLNMCNENIKCLFHYL